METTVGIFRSRQEMDRALAQLRALDIGYDKISVLQPGMTNRQVEAYIPTSDSEGAGTAAALGGAIGGAIGIGAGASLGAAVVSLFVPGVGPIIVAGILGAVLVGGGAVMAGIQAGNALEGGLAKGLPHDELFVYEDALRHGHSVVVVNADESEVTARIHDALARAGAESIDAARESWWLGLRDVEEEHYNHEHDSFKKDELTYRRGFEAALHPQLRYLPYDDAAAQINSELRADPAFRAGFERGQAYQRNWDDKHRDMSDTLP
jgi:hypothetical protein